MVEQFRKGALQAGAMENELKKLQTEMIGLTKGDMKAELAANEAAVLAKLKEDFTKKAQIVQKARIALNAQKEALVSQGVLSRVQPGAAGASPAKGAATNMANANASTTVTSGSTSGSTLKVEDSQASLQRSSSIVSHNRTPSAVSHHFI